MHKIFSRVHHLNVRVTALFLLFGILAVANFLIIHAESRRIKELEEQERALVSLEGLPARLIFEQTLGEAAAIIQQQFSENIYQLRAMETGTGQQDKARLMESLQAMEGLSGNATVAEYVADWQRLHGTFLVRLRTVQKQLAREQAAEERRFNFILLALMLANLTGLIIGYSLFRVVVIRPLAHIGRVSIQISAGEAAEKLPYRQQDEIGAIAKAMNRLMDSLQYARDFVVHIGQGKLDAVYEGIEVEKEQNTRSLAGVLLGMQQQLRQIRQEEDQRRWTAEGLSMFSDIIRTEQDSLEQLGDKLVSGLARFMNVNQAAFYVVEGEGEELSCCLKACYAFNRKKYLQMQLAFGEGLVGQACLDREMVYLTDVPASYASIKSGLGGASPKAVLIMPMLYNNEVHGVLELASFNLFAPHEITFVQKLAESLGASLMAIRTNYKTRKLLEESRYMTEQLRAQEEELRQNLEEMHATQEDVQRSARQEALLGQELATRIAALDAAALMTESDLFGNFTYVNNKFCEVAQYRPDEVLGKPHNILRHPDNPKSLFREMWDTIKAGRIFKGRYPNRAKDGSTYWVDATVVPVLDEDGKPIKYIGVLFDITGQVLREQQFKELLADIKLTRQPVVDME